MKMDLIANRINHGTLRMRFVILAKCIKVQLFQHFAINKKATMAPLELIVRLVILGVILYFVTSGITSFFKSSAEADRSFSDFVLELDDARKWAVGERRQIELVMDSDTVIWAFASKLSSLKKMTRNFPYTESSGFIVQYEIARPQQCGDNENACVCLCKHISLSDRTEVNGIERYSCKGENLICKEMSPGFSLRTSTLIESLQPYFFGDVSGKAYEDNFVDGGFILGRTSLIPGQGESENAEAPRRDTVSVERGRFLINVCRRGDLCSESAAASATS